MFIDSETGKLVNIHAPYKGRSRLDTKELREAIGVIEIADDPAPEDYSEDTYFRTEDWNATQRPYIVYTRKPEEIIVEAANNKIKAQIVALEDQQGRAIREAVLTGDKTRLAELDTQIAALRSQLR